MSNTLKEYFRLPNRYAACIAGEAGTNQRGFFRFGEGLMCYGRASGGEVSDDPEHAGFDAAGGVWADNGRLVLPFDLDEVVRALRYEEYQTQAQRVGALSNPLVRSAYYTVRPWLPRHLKERLQRRALADWKKISFPGWPVDFTVDHLFKALMRRLTEYYSTDSIPFVWFWPDSHRGSVIVTYDVETDAGQLLCPDLLDLTESYGFRAAFQFVPEERYRIREGILNQIKDRGHEVNVHGLNHDGRLFEDREEFLRRAEKINAYGRQFGSSGFRSPVLYRNQAWFDALQFDYDMSVPNTARLEAQRGGCCTVFPYFVGDLVELPLTTTEDYTLFRILKDYAIDLWREQIEQVVREHGLITILAHPDYLGERRARNAFEMLLAHLRDRVESDGLWAALPREVTSWWRARSRMRLSETDGGRHIEGDGADRAKIAHAWPDGDSVRYGLDG